MATRREAESVKGTRTPTQRRPSLRLERSARTLQEDDDAPYAPPKALPFPFRLFVNVLVAVVPHERVIDFIMDDQGAREACLRAPHRTACATYCAAEWDALMHKMKQMACMQKPPGARLSPGRVCVRTGGRLVCADIFESLDEMGERGYVGLGARACAAPLGADYVVIMEHPVAIIDASTQCGADMWMLLERGVA